MATTIENLVLKVKVDGAGAVKNLSGTIQNLSQDVTDFTSGAGSFGNSIGAIIGKLGPFGAAVGVIGGALTALGGAAVRIAGELTDIADATGISAGALLNFKQSITDAGGSADSFSKIASKLSVSIGEANSGNEKFQKSFKDLGVTVRDANGNLRPTETILQDVLRSLAGISNPAERAAKAVEILGKEAAKLDLTNLNAASDAETTKYVANLDKVNQAVDRIRNSLERKVVNLFGGALDAFDRSQKLAAEAEAAANARGKTVVRDPRLGTAMEVEMTKQQKAAYDINKTIEAGEADHQREMSRLKKLGSTATATAAGGDYGARSEAGIKAAAESAKRIQLSQMEAEKAITTSGLGEIAKIRKNAEYDIQKEIINIRGQDKMTDVEKEAEIAAKRVEIMAKANAQIAEVQERQNKAIANQSTEFERQQALILNKLDLETQLVGKTEEETQQLRAQRQLAQDYLAEQEKLIKQRDNLGKGEEAQAAKINQLIQSNADAYNRQSEALTNSITASQTANLLEKDRLATIQRMTDAYEQQARIQDTLAGIQRNILDEQRAADFDVAQKDRTPRQKQVAQIEESSRRAALAASRAFAAAFEDGGDGLTPERAAELAKGLKLIEDGYAGITKRQIESLETSKTFSEGWKEAFTAYQEEANNSAQQATTYFETFTRGFEDAFVRFVQTGKLSFKDLANSIIADFARIQARNLLMGLFDGGGAESLGKFFGGGRANGGPVGFGGAYMVGERGPEMFVPRTSGTIIPNSAMSSGSQVTNVSYSIQAVDASSFRQMLAREPEFLYAVTEKGRSSIPGGRR